MGLRKIMPALALIAYLASVSVAQGGSAPVTVPTVAWELGSVRGVKLRKGTSADYALRYSVTVPEGTAANYTVSIEVCRWVGVVGDVPDTIDACSTSQEVSLTALGEVEPGTKYEGLVRFGYDD